MAAIIGKLYASCGTGGAGCISIVPEHEPLLTGTGTGLIKSATGGTNSLYGDIGDATLMPKEQGFVALSIGTIPSPCCSEGMVPLVSFRSLFVLVAADLVVAEVSEFLIVINASRASDVDEERM